MVLYTIQKRGIMIDEFIKFYTKIFDYALIIQVIVISFSVVIVLSPVKIGAKPILFGTAKAAGFFVAEILIHSFLFAIGGWELRGNSFLLGYIFCITLYTIFFCRFTPKVRLIMASTIFAVSITVLEFGGLFGRLLENTFIDSGVVFDWPGLIKPLSSILVICFAVLQSKFSMKKYSDVHITGMILIVTGNLLSAAVCILYEAFYSARGLVHLGFSSLVFISLYIINLVSYMMIFFVCRERNNVIALKAEKQIADTHAELMQLSEKNLGYIRQLRHDIKNQYSYINMLLENDQYAEVKKYFKSLGDDVIIPLSYIDSGNKNIDAILNMEMSKANAYDVEMDIKVIVPPILPFSDSALCSIVSNLVDNAIEACIRNDMKEEGVSIQIYPRHDYLYICVSNHLPSDTDTDRLLTLNTSKTDHSQHGFGTRIIKRLVQEYNGYVTFTVENNIFVAEVMLDLMNSTKAD